MTVPVRNSNWIYRDLDAATHGAFRESVQLGRPDDYWTLDGCTYAMDVRPAPGHPTLIASFTSAAGQINTWHADTRWIQFNVADTVFTSLTPGKYYYDLLVTAPDGFTYQRLRGRFNLHKSVTT